MLGKKKINSKQHKIDTFMNVCLVLHMCTCFLLHTKSCPEYHIFGSLS